MEPSKLPSADYYNQNDNLRVNSSDKRPFSRRHKSVPGLMASIISDTDEENKLKVRQQNSTQISFSHENE